MAVLWHNINTEKTAACRKKRLSDGQGKRDCGKRDAEGAKKKD